MTNASDQNPSAGDAESGAPPEIRNLPAVIADAPAPPIPADRLKGQPVMVSRSMAERKAEVQTN